MLLWAASDMHAQKFGVKTDALYWMTTTPNIGFEVGLGKRTTLELSGGYNPWTLNSSDDRNTKVRHFLITPEFRYWFCERFQGHHMGINAIYSLYNIGNVPVPFVPEATASRYEGWAAGAGVTYGYTWILGKRWNMEANVGVGYVYTEYDRYRNRVCGIYQESACRHLFLPTEIGLKFIYMIK